MSMSSILGHGVFLFGLLWLAFVRPRFRRRSERRDRHPEQPLVEPQARRRVPLERLPDSSSLAGIPLRILLSDRSGPGALLRDMLLTRPPPRDR